MATITQDPTVASWTPINMWAMLRALINNNVPILTINGIQFPIVSGANGTYVGQAGKGALLIDYGNGILYQNTGTIASPNWTIAGGGGVNPAVPSEDYFIITPLPANAAISPSASATYTITKPGAGFFTLAAPIPGGPGVGNDGVDLTIVSTTPYQHIISVVGLLQTGTAAQNTIVFPQFAGGEVDLMAYNGKWTVLNSQLVVFQ